MKQNLLFNSILALIILIVFSIDLDAQNHVTTYAGTGSSGFMNGDTSVAEFNRPFGICIDQEGNLYLADAYNHCIRKIGIDGQVSTYAGTQGQSGHVDGPALEAKFNQPLNLCMDDEGNMYVSDFINQRIRKISADMMVSTIAGTGIAGYAEGPAMEAQFNYPRGICLDDTGNIYIGDSWNHRIRKISVDGMVSTWAGGGTTIGVQSVGDWIDASDTAARFYTPCEVSIDQENNIFVADAYNHRIRKIDPDRMVTTVAGSGGFGPNGGGFNNGTPLEAQFDTPTALQVITDGTIFVGDGANHVLRRVYPEEVVTYAGSGTEGFLDGPDSLAQFNFPRGNVMDYNMNRLYIVDYNNHAVRILHLASGVNIDESSIQNHELKIYPNPSDNVFHIELNRIHKEVSLSLNNIAGEQLFSGVYNNTKRIQIQLGHLAHGIYFLSLNMGGNRIGVHKLVVSK